MTEQACAQCGGPLPPATRIGRPRIYCSVVCRKRREHELESARVRLRCADGLIEYRRTQRVGVNWWGSEQGLVIAREKAIAERDRVADQLRELEVS